eukprot:11031494-Karenia_brevis.AAC.1
MASQSHMSAASVTKANAPRVCQHNMVLRKVVISFGVVIFSNMIRAKNDAMGIKKFIDNHDEIDCSN